MNHSDEKKAAHLLQRTKGWSAALAAGYIATLTPQEVATFARLEDSPILRGDEVSQVIDEVEDRIAAEEALKKQQGPGDRSQESLEE